MNASTFRAMEGSIENNFCDDDGNVNASPKEINEFLLSQGWTEQEVNDYIAEMYNESLPSPLPVSHWKPFDEIIEGVSKVIKDKKWNWAANQHCKYVSIRVDMRDGTAILMDRDKEVITLDQLKRQAF